MLHVFHVKESQEFSIIYLIKLNNVLLNAQVNISIASMEINTFVRNV